MVSVARVAPLAGSVDRNQANVNTMEVKGMVAPLAGSVDRNRSIVCIFTAASVAHLAGSVDRNK